MKKFADNRPYLEKQYEQPFVPASGLSLDELKTDFEQHCAANPNEPLILKRAYLMNLVCRKGRIVIEPENMFAGKVEGRTLLDEMRYEYTRKAWTEEFGEWHGWCNVSDLELGIGYMIDYSHISPDWPAILRLGLPGLRDRAAKGDTPLHRAVVMVYESAMELCRRLGWPQLAERPPQTLHEAFELAYLFHELEENEGEQVRTMGWFDRLYIDFYRGDIESGRLTRESAKELIKYFWFAFYAKTQGKLFGKNFCFGPEINELSYLGMETYYEMNVVDPKLSVRVTPDTPQDFLELCARNIRDGRTGIVFLNEQVVVESLVKHGRTPADAADFIPIGCYEPAVLGKEVSLSGATFIYLPNVLLHTLKQGRQYHTFGELKADFFRVLKEATVYMAKQQSRCEKIWPLSNPVPFLSGSYLECMESGKDVTEGGAKYNTTGTVVSHIADYVDSMAAVEYLVYQEKCCTLDELRAALAADWKGCERLQLLAKNRAPKWGNNDERADKFAIEVSEFIAPLLSSLDNGRGGKFTPSIYGQLVVERGAATGAFPSGRNAGEPLSKNMDAAIGMDRNGITSLMNSVLKIDYTRYPCGTCLDLMLHPSAVKGADGIAALVALVRTFIGQGGSGLQFNIFDAATLRDAQIHPEAYSNLQVRVCGWNARFIDLKPEAQETFIAQAEAMA